MKIILDTHAFLWFAENSKKLSQTANILLNNQENKLLLSIASVWEMQIKIGIGKLQLEESLTEIVAKQREVNEVEIFPINLDHIWQLDSLPLHHKDPFDRMLIAQAITENLPILTIDSIFHKYQVNIIW